MVSIGRGHDGRAEAPADRRAVARAFAAPGDGELRRDPPDQRAGRDGLPGGAERAPDAGHRPPGVRALARARGGPGNRRGAARGRAGARRLLRHGRRPAQGGTHERRRADARAGPDRHHQSAEPGAALRGACGTSSCRTPDTPSRCTSSPPAGPAWSRAGRAAGWPPLCFAGHLDTVPLGAAPWTRDPFGGEIDGGPALRARLERHEERRRRHRRARRCGSRGRRCARPGSTLVLVAGEETGCEGAAHLAADAAARSAAPARWWSASPPGTGPSIGHKGALWLEARTRGVTAHGSMPAAAA